MNTQKIIQSQYLAALTIFEKVIVKCPAALWNAPGERQTMKHTKKKIDLDWVEIQPA